MRNPVSLVRLGRMHSPAAMRNKGPIADVLQPYLASVGAGGSVLEVSSGCGTHVAHLAKLFPDLVWHPTEYNKELLPNIRRNIEAAKVANVRDPVFLDISRPAEQFAPASFDAMFNVNLMHISPFACTEGLFAATGRLLKHAGRLYTYGPFSENGVLAPESNVNFHRILTEENSEWGIRDVTQLIDEAAKNDLCLDATHEMPANNKLYVWKRL